MSYSICIFEDNHCSKLYPLTLTRPTFDLRCGIFTLQEKVQHYFPEHSVSLFCRNYLKDYIQEENPDLPVNQVKADSCLFINGRVIADANLPKMLTDSKEQLFLYKDQVVAAYLKGANINDFVKILQNETDLREFKNVAFVDLDTLNMVQYSWDLVHHNPSEIERDFDYLNQGGMIEGRISEYAVIENKERVYIGKNAVVQAGAILDAQGGPIYIGDNAKVMSNAVIDGPVFVGANSAIKIAAKIYEGTSIGEVCKVGGEVEESIIHSYSNKQHDGFLGHAYVGQWVNLGADTNNSDLKNNYGSVKVHVDGKLIDSGSMFVGLCIGDHSKAGINTMFNTGTVVGIMSNVYGAGFPPKYLPSYSWGGAEGIVEHQLDKALDTAQRVMARRKKEFTAAYEKIFQHAFEITRSERS